jgi:hypothetical protein
MPKALRLWQTVVFALCAVGLFAIVEGAWATYNLEGDIFGGAVYNPLTAAPFLNGEFAYPMLARGRLVGALVLGPKSTGEPYAPDESAAIAQLAHGVGVVALELLGARRTGSNEEICALLRSLEASSCAANDALRALPDAVAERIRNTRN